MTKKIVLLSICKNVVWKETAKYLKLYRMKYINDLDTYNAFSSAVIELYRKVEYKIHSKWLRYTRLEYRKKIEKLETEIIKKLAKGK